MNTLSNKSARRGLIGFVAVLSSLSAAGNAAAEEVTPLRYGAGMTFERDSNLFRLDPAMPGGVQADTITSGYAYVGFDTTLSRQRLYGNLNFGKAKFSRYSELDYDKQDIKLGWDGDFPGQIHTSLIGTRSSQLANFADLNTRRRNVITRDDVQLDLDVPMIANWRLVGGGGGNQTRNSNAFDSLNNSDGNTARGGLRYVTAYGNQIDLIAQTSEFKYPNRAANRFYDSSYRERTGFARILWTPTGASRIDGDVGYLERRNKNYDARDFSGPSFHLNWYWTPTGATDVKVSAYRTMGAAGDNEFDAAVTKAVKIEPTWHATGKITLSAQAEVGKRRYLDSIFEGLPIADLIPGRDDDFGNWGLTFSYEALRWLLVDIGYHGERRHSNRSLRDFTDQIGSVTVQIGF